MDEAVPRQAEEGMGDEDEALPLRRGTDADAADVATPWQTYFDECRDVTLPNGRGQFRQPPFLIGLPGFLAHSTLATIGRLPEVPLHVGRPGHLQSEFPNLQFV